MQKCSSLSFSLTTLWLFVAHFSNAIAADFTIINGQTETTTQNLTGNETGTIDTGGAITVPGNSTFGVNAQNDNNIVNNAGSVSTTGEISPVIKIIGNNNIVNNTGSISNTLDLGLMGVLSHGISSSGTFNSINNEGSILTNGAFSNAVLSSGTSNNIFNNGSISTTGFNAFGITFGGVSTTFINGNSGTISTTGNDADAIYSDDTNASITNNNVINTTGEAADGIRSEGADAVVDNNGTISTTGDAVIAFGAASGIRTSGANFTVNNSGTISTSGNGSEGIISTGTNATINNSNTITTSGNANAYGTSSAIKSDGSDTSINNSGSISTTGNSAVGIEASGTDTAISNNGSISTTNTSAHGIEASGDRSTIINNSTISTSGITASGIESAGVDNIVNNNGGIITSGDSTASVTARGLNTTVNNNGAITASGDTATGVLSTANNVTINNNGSISMTGDSSIGVTTVGNDSTINNSRLISATGTNSYAISGGSNDITLNLLTGSQIIGQIDLGDNGGDWDSVNIYTNSGLSTTITFDNTESVTLLGVPGVVMSSASSKTAILIDPTIDSTRSIELTTLTNSIHRVISQRMAHTPTTKPIQVAALNLSSGMLFQEQEPIAWAQLFGGNRDRDSEGNNLAYDHDYVGFTLGYEWDKNTTRIGLMGGVANADTETKTTSANTKTNSYYLGIYGHFKFDSVNLTTSLLAGYSEYDNNRLVIDNLNGYEVADSDFSSLFLSPSLTLSAAFSMNEQVELRPSASINYSVAQLDNYHESGTTRSNLNVDDRTISALTARLQLAAAYKLNPTNELELRLGMTTRHTNDDDVKANLASSVFRYGNTGDKSVSGGYAGANLRIASQNNLNIVADIEFETASGGEDNISGQISLEYQF